MRKARLLIFVDMKIEYIDCCGNLVCFILYSWSCLLLNKATVKYYQPGFCVYHWLCMRGQGSTPSYISSPPPVRLAKGLLMFFFTLTSQGSLMFHKLRPVDQLRHLLVSNVGGDGEEIERFFKLHQVIVPCSMVFQIGSNKAVKILCINCK